MCVCVYLDSINEHMVFDLIKLFSTVIMSLSFLLFQKNHNRIESNRFAPEAAQPSHQNTHTQYTNRFDQSTKGQIFKQILTHNTHTDMPIWHFKFLCVLHK